MEFGKFGVVVKIEDNVLACLVAFAILLVHIQICTKNEKFSSIFPNLQVGSMLGTLIGSAISATGLVSSRFGEDRDGIHVIPWKHDGSGCNINSDGNAGNDDKC